MNIGRNRFATIHTLACAFAMSALINTATAQLQHGAIKVIENDANNTPASVTLTRVGGHGSWSTVSDDGVDSSNRGDYVVDFGTGNDAALGIPIVSVYQTERSEESVEQDPYYATAASARSGSGSGRYFFSTHESPTGQEVNFNVAFAYFPIEDGWITGTAYNAENNGNLVEFVGHPDIALRNETTATESGFELIDSTADKGLYKLTLEGYDLRRDGVLLAGAARNEDNRVAINIANDGTATLNVIDNGAESGGENDAVSFAFIPAGTPGVVMGRVTASGRKLFSQGEYNVAMVNQPSSNGIFRISIPGQSPFSGTLVAMPHTELTGTSQDNIVTVTPELVTWRVETYDIAALPDGLTLQDLDSGDVAFHFAFFPNSADIQPAPEPNRDYQQRLNDIVSTRFSVTERSPGNELGEMRAERVAGSDALDVFADNRGDIGISYLGARLAAYADNGADTAEGVIIGCPSQLNRDNSATGGKNGWSTLSFDNAMVRTSQASTGQEMNSDFALAMFPTGLGLNQGADLVAPDGHSTIGITGNAASEGVVMAINWDNSSRIVAAQPDGWAFDLTVYETTDGSVAADSAEFGYVYLPYDMPRLVAGRIDADGDMLSGTGQFSLASAVSADGYEVTAITILGVDATEDGILLLTATDGPYAMAWEPGLDGSFHVAGFDCRDQSIGRTGFMFAYIRYDESCANCVGDLNQDCLVNAEDTDLLITNMGLTEATYDDGDLTGDTNVNLADYAVIQRFYLDDCDDLGVGPEHPVLVYPQSNGHIPASPASLTVSLTNTDGGPMSVSYFGRKLNAADPFTMVMLPDTQNYSEKYPATFDAQTQWIVDNQESLNIAYVAHLGDIVQRANRINEWMNADASMSILEEIPGLPYGLSVGNHDQYPCCSGAPDGTSNFNLFFPYTRYEGIVPWYGGHYGNDNDNSYILFSASGLDFIAIHLEFDTDANPEVLAWADQVLTDYSDRRAIIATHYMVGGGNPASFSYQGRCIYEALKHHTNLFFMTGGHISAEGRRTDVYRGHTIYSTLTDYQSRSNGGDGWMRYYEFRPQDNAIVARTYSPTLGRYELDNSSQFVLPYDMSGNQFQSIGTVGNVASGATATINWPEVESGQRYEWYVTVQDRNGRTSSNTWRFNVE